MAALTNIALGKPCWQSSTLSPDTQADLATHADGLRSGFAARTAPGSKTVPAVWEVDLGADYDISDVIIMNTESNRCRLRDITVVIQRGDTVVWRSSLLNAENKLHSPLRIPCPLARPYTGDRVQISRKPDFDLSGADNGDQDKDSLNLAQVIVMGTATTVKTSSAVVVIDGVQTQQAAGLLLSDLKAVYGPNAYLTNYDNTHEQYLNPSYALQANYTYTLVKGTAESRPTLDKKGSFFSSSKGSLAQSTGALPVRIPPSSRDAGSPASGFSSPRSTSAPSINPSPSSTPSTTPGTTPTAGTGAAASSARPPITGHRKHAMSTPALVEPHRKRNITPDEATRALLAACTLDDVEGATTALENKASLTARDEEGFTPLHLASVHASARVAKMLIQRGADLEAREEGRTPLHWAALSGSDSVVKVLLRAGANREARDEDGTTPVEYATAQGHLSTASIIENPLATTMDEIELPGTTTSLRAPSPAAQMLNISMAAGPEDATRTLFDAAAEGNAVLVAACLKRMAQVGDRDDNGDTPLLVAARHGHRDVVSLLLDGGAKLEERDRDGETSLHLACINGHANLVQLLLSRGANMSLTSEGGRTPLHWAAIGGHSAVAKILLQGGANRMAKDESGCTPFEYAVVNGHHETSDIIKPL